MSRDAVLRRDGGGGEGGAMTSDRRSVAVPSMRICGWKTSTSSSSRKLTLFGRERARRRRSEPERNSERDGDGDGDGGDVCEGVGEGVRRCERMDRKRLLRSEPESDSAPESEPELESEQRDCSPGGSEGPLLRQLLGYGAFEVAAPDRIVGRDANGGTVRERLPRSRGLWQECWRPLCAVCFGCRLE